jgi:hypothetical protein
MQFFFRPCQPREENLLGPQGAQAWRLVLAQKTALQGFRRGVTALAWLRNSSCSQWLGLQILLKKNTFSGAKYSALCNQYGLKMNYVNFTPDIKHVTKAAVLATAVLKLIKFRCYAKKYRRYSQIKLQKLLCDADRQMCEVMRRAKLLDVLYLFAQLFN